MKKPRSTLITVTVGAALAIGAALLTTGPASASAHEPQSASASAGLISGPLIDGPLVNVDDGLGIGDIRIGQFQ